MFVNPDGQQSPSHHSEDTFNRIMTPYEHRTILKRRARILGEVGHHGNSIARCNGHMRARCNEPSIRQTRLVTQHCLRYEKCSTSRYFGALTQQVEGRLLDIATRHSAWNSDKGHLLSPNPAREGSQTRVREPKIALDCLDHWVGT
ncbi:hypothetical protein C4E04_01240 [Microvirga sp. 17 mud 1-3]|nr:hypothetical protein C4E04_01240 [Microvirga sp. 17 mud 1-3]